MKSLYISEQGCYLSVKQEQLIIKQGEQILAVAQIPLIEQILIFGKSQVTTQAIRACLERQIPILYLSRMGYCYGRMISIERGYRNLSRLQQKLTDDQRLSVAKQIVTVKLKNSRVILLRQQRKKNLDELKNIIQSMEYLILQAQTVDSLDKLMGYEGAGAHSYFRALGECLNNPDFSFLGRTRRPPGNPVNAMLSFGYQVLWNHLMTLIELQELDPYSGCLHQGSYRHAALVSDLLEEFRAPIIDSLMLNLVNKHIISLNDFEYQDSGCYLNETGRKKFLKAFLQKMDEPVKTLENETEPRWHLLMQQVKKFKNFVYDPDSGYQPYLIT